MDCRDGCCGILFYRGVSGEIRGVITFLFRPGNRCAEKIYVDKEMLFRIIHLFTAISGIFFILMGAILCAVLSGVFVKVLCYLGRNTLYIFAVHLPLLEFARPIGKYVIGSNGLGYDSIVFLTDLVLAIIVSWGLKIGKDSFSKKLPHYSPTGIIE